MIESDVLSIYLSIFCVDGYAIVILIYCKSMYALARSVLQY